MNYLLDLGIKRKTLDKITEKNGEAISLSIECNEKNITNIIKHLKNIGIKNIDDLLIYEIDFFLNDFEIIKNRIKINDYEKIYNINTDWTYIEEI